MNPKEPIPCVCGISGVRTFVTSVVSQLPNIPGTKRSTPWDLKVDQKEEAKRLKGWPRAGWYPPTHPLLSYPVLPTSPEQPGLGLAELDQLRFSSPHLSRTARGSEKRDEVCWNPSGQQRLPLSGGEKKKNEESRPPKNTPYKNKKTLENQEFHFFVCFTLPPINMEPHVRIQDPRVRFSWEGIF